MFTRIFSDSGDFLFSQAHISSPHGICHPAPDIATKLAFFIRKPLRKILPF